MCHPWLAVIIDLWYHCLCESIAAFHAKQRDLASMAAAYIYCSFQVSDIFISVDRGKVSEQVTFFCHTNSFWTRGFGNRLLTCVIRRKETHNSLNSEYNNNTIKVQVFLLYFIIRVWYCYCTLRGNVQNTYNLTEAFGEPFHLHVIVLLLYFHCTYVCTFIVLHEVNFKTNTISYACNMSHVQCSETAIPAYFHSILIVCIICLLYF